MLISPYTNKPKEEWSEITQNLVVQHPLKAEELKNFVLEAWNSLFLSHIGKHRLQFGKDIFPKPQIIGALMHELIPAEIVATYPDQWKREEFKDEKDIVCLRDDFFSIELKTSSNPTQIFGNRSYAQVPNASKKGKNGYYLTVNFENLCKNKPVPAISLIRFGWLDHTDWIGQAASTGQQARLAPEIYNLKFVTLYQKF